jgi:hypothetical protein
MNRQVQVFEIDTEAKPSPCLRPVTGFAVTGTTVEEARRAALDRLAAEGRCVRSLSFCTDGGLVAVVEVRAPQGKSAQSCSACRSR